MKADFSLSSARIKALKTELAKLTDVDYLKKELSKIAAEVKGFDVHLSLSPHAKRRLRMLESKFRELKIRLAALQKHVDKEVNKIASILRSSIGLAKGAMAKTAAKKKTGKKSTTRRKAGG